MNIVVLDGQIENPGDLSWDAIRQFGELTIYDKTPRDDDNEIIRRIGDADIVITNKTPINAQVLKACSGVRLICVLATGYNVVDVKAASRQSVSVANVPAYGTRIVAQYAVGMLLELCAHYGHHSQTVRDGRWCKADDFCYWDYPIVELDQKIAGIIGLGRIGQVTAQIVKALGMDVIAFSGHESEEGKKVARYVTPDELYKTADVIFLHCPLFPETEGIINKETIARMKDGVMIINNSRGPLIVEQDLADALNSGKVAAAAVDVVSEEPIKPDNPLLSAKNCMITPHISWAAKEARARIMETTVANIEAFLDNAPQNIVTN